MESDYFYPALADRRTPQEWANADDGDLLERARQRTAEMLAAPHPMHISPADRDIRARFDILTATRTLNPCTCLLSPRHQILSRQSPRSQHPFRRIIEFGEVVEVYHRLGYDFTCLSDHLHTNVCRDHCQ